VLDKLAPGGYGQEIGEMVRKPRRWFSCHYDVTRANHDFQSTRMQQILDIGEVTQPLSFQKM